MAETTFDGENSLNILNAKIETMASHISDPSNSYMKNLYHNHNLYDPGDIDYFNQRYRFGLFDPNGAVQSCREYLFFTKPDLPIFTRDPKTGIPGAFNEYLASDKYWVELKANNKNIFNCLQDSLYLAAGKKKDRFNHLLENSVSNNLELPALSSEMIETPNTMYGVNIQYRGSSEASNDNYDFSLEFRDTKDLSVFNFFKAYDDFETLKHHGVIRPWIRHIADKILYDTFSIYKFIVSEDGETILFYAKLYGVIPKNVPREIFSSTSFDNGLSYNIDFHAAFMRDNDPIIISEFNSLSKEYYNSLPYQVEIYNDILDRADNRPACAAFIEKAKRGTKTVYKLKWRGDKKA